MTLYFTAMEHALEHQDEHYAAALKPRNSEQWDRRRAIMALVFKKFKWYEIGSGAIVSYRERFRAKNDNRLPASQHQYARLRQWLEKQRSSKKIMRVFDQLLCLYGALHSMGLTMLTGAFGLYIKKREADIGFADSSAIVEFSKDSSLVETCNLVEIAHCLMEALPENHENRKVFTDFISYQFSAHELKSSAPKVVTVNGVKRARNTIVTGVEIYLSSHGYMPVSYDLRYTEGVFCEERLRDVVLKGSLILDSEYAEWRAIGSSIVDLPEITFKKK